LNQLNPEKNDFQAGIWQNSEIPYPGIGLRKFWDLSPSIFLLNLIFHVLSLPVRERGLKPPSTPGQDQAAGKKGLFIKRPPAYHP
jgi:hypothetical protein